MGNEKQPEISQNPQQNTSIENIEAFKTPNTKSQLEGLKESIETQKKIDILKKSKLSTLVWFFDFISYLSSLQNSDKLNSVIKVLQSEGWEDKLADYFDVNSINLWFWFFTDKTYQDFYNTYIKIIEFDINKTNKEKIFFQEEKIKKYQENKPIFQEIKNKLHNYEDFKGISLKLENKEKELGKNIEKNKTDEAIKNLNEINEILSSNKDFIFETLLSKYKKSWDQKDRESIIQIAQSFTSLWVIDEEKQKQIIQEVFNIEKSFSTEKSLSKSTDESIILEHEQKWDTLVRETDKANYTIKDWVITFVQKWVTSPMKLVDYENNDKETKAYLKKEKLWNQIKTLHSDLDKNEFLIKKLSDIWQLDRNKTKIDKSQINILLWEIWEQIPDLINNLQIIYASREDSEKQLWKLVWLIYTYTQWWNNLGINENDTLEMKVFTCRQKIEDKNNTIRKKILEWEKQIKEIEKEYPNLSKIDINKKILEKEKRMQDTVNFCDEYWLSALWNIANIKRVIKEFNLKLTDRQIPLDIWTWPNFLDSFKNDIDWGLTKSLKFFIAKLLWKEENINNIYKEWNLWLHKTDKSTFNSDTWDSESINKDYLEKLLKERWVLNKKTWELNIYKVQELLEEWDTPDLNQEDNKK